MTTENKKYDYIAKFTGLGEKGVITKNDTCIVPISVGQEYHEGKKFIATVELISKHFKECTISVCDTLQRHTIATLENSNQGDLYSNIAKKNGDEWFERTKPIFDQHLNILYTVRRWDDWFKHKDYDFYRKKVDELYSTDKKFVSIVDDLIQAFSNRLKKKNYKFDEKIAFENSKKYILEECAAMSIWYDEGYNIDVYPPIRSAAIEYTFSKIKKDHYGKLLKPIGLKFKKLNSFNLTSRIALEKIINILPGHVYWKDKTGRFLGCNELQAKNYGCKYVHDLIGKYDKDVVKPHLAKRIAKNDKKTLETKKSSMIEEETFVTLKNKRKKIWVVSQKAPILDKKENVIGLVGVSLDITKQKQAEKKLADTAKDLEELLATKERLTGVLAHDINSPLHAIKGIIDCLNESEELSIEQFQALLPTLLESIDTLTDLSKNILETLKRRQKGEKFVFFRKNIVSTINKVLITYKYKTQINFHTECNKIFLQVDELKIVQLIRNLLDNAVKYKEDNFPIWINIKCSEDIEIWVSNKGILPEGDEKKVFDQFFQSKKHKKQKKGFGIGLSTCREIITAHKGKIEMRQNRAERMISVVISLPYDKNQIKEEVNKNEEENSVICG